MEGDKKVEHIMKFLRHIISFFKRADEDHIAEYTAQCAYYTFLSFIPFIILVLSFVKYLNIETNRLVQIFTAILPYSMKNSVVDIIQEMYSKSFETISISAVFMLWSSSKGFYALNKGLSAIYNKEEKEENYIFLRIKGLIGAILALALIVIILILLVFGNILEQSINENFQNFSKLLEFIISARIVISISSLFVIFLLMYRVTQNKYGVKLRNCILGALFSSTLWYLISFFFSIYVDIFTNFSIIYGSLATITLMMMWLYVIIYVILIGAEINVMTEDKMDSIFFRIKKFRKLKSNTLKNN